MRKIQDTIEKIFPYEGLILIVFLLLYIIEKMLILLIIKFI